MRRCQFIIREHPVILNRAPTLHRLGIQAFQPKLIEGKAIQLHPLVCTAFNADFDGDQMAVHLPLGNAAILEAQLLMLASHNILNPANGAPITVPSQDMVLGLYYITKLKKHTKEDPVNGEGMTFYSSEEVKIAYNEGMLDLHASIKVKIDDVVDGNPVNHIVETTTGRVIFNELVPAEVGFVNEVLTKKSLRDIISNIIKISGVPDTANDPYYRNYVFDSLSSQFNGQKSEFRRNEKSFDLRDVELIIERLNKIDTNKLEVKVNKVIKHDLFISKMFSQKTVKVFI